MLLFTSAYMVLLLHTLLKILSSHQSVMASSVYNRSRMEILLEHGQFAWVHGALQSLAQHYGTRCR